MASLAPPMRTFQIRGPFGLQMTFRTKVAGKLWFRYPRLPESLPQDTTNATIAAGHESSDQLYIDIPMGVDNDRVESTRSPSPAPTEVELTQEEIVLDIQQKGIKVRDFAYEKPAAGIKPVPELFDPDKGLGEYDFRLSMPQRTTPIPGKILRRLLDIGWVTMQQARQWWHQMDWDALAAHDKRPRYPWRCRGLAFPTPEEREALRMSRGAYVMAVERAQIEERAYMLVNHLHAHPQPQPQSRSEEEEVVETMGGLSQSRGEKRQFSEDGDEAAGGNNDDGTNPPNTKRRRVEDEWGMEGVIGTMLKPPLQQFPAPMSAYDGEVHSFTATTSAAPAQQIPAGPSTTTALPSNPPVRTLRRQTTFANVLTSC